MYLCTYYPSDLLASFDAAAQLTSLEELLAQGTDIRVILRLLCLASITSGGIKNKTLENLKRDFLQVIGYPVQSVSKSPNPRLDLWICTLIDPPPPFFRFATSSIQPHPAGEHIFQATPGDPAQAATTPGG